jgi:hypothetical protein
LYQPFAGLIQDNNGTTFLASPVRLPWLETESAEWEEFP